jgi:hypothetical protein
MSYNQLFRQRLIPVKMMFVNRLQTWRGTQVAEGDGLLNR